MENKIIELRNWFRMNGEMDFERSGKKEDPGKFITYKCADIESIFAGALENVSTSEKDLRVCEVIDSAWISVNERLPELKGEFPDRSSDTVLAWIPSGMILAKYLYIDEGDDGKGYVWCQVYDGLDGDAEWDDNYEVSHWCPLPTAPN